MLTPLCTHFSSDPGTVSWVGSLLCGVYLMSGPVVGGLVNRFGCRTVCIAGSCIAFASFALSVFSVNVPMLMLLYGVCGGFGLGLIYLPAVCAVGYYFEKKRALATGISVCGSGVGTFVFAPLGTYLLEQYGEISSELNIPNKLSNNNSRATMTLSRLEGRQHHLRGAVSAVRRVRGPHEAALRPGHRKGGGRRRPGRGRVGKYFNAV